MQQKKEKLAILIDEYGGVSGMVTLEDLIEVIVGDIHEEYEEAEPEIIEQEPGHVYSLSGSIALSDLKEEFHLDVDSVYDTLSGYSIEALGYIPIRKGTSSYCNHPGSGLRDPEKWMTVRSAG